MTSWKCPHCSKWIGSMAVHEDCERKQEERSSEIGQKAERIMKEERDIFLRNARVKMTTVHR